MHDRLAGLDSGSVSHLSASACGSHGPGQCTAERQSTGPKHTHSASSPQLFELRHIVHRTQMRTIDCGPCGQDQATHEEDPGGVATHVRLLGDRRAKMDVDVGSEFYPRHIAFT